MAEDRWSQSYCDPNVWWVGRLGDCYYWTPNHGGAYYMGGDLHAVAYRNINFECGLAGEPVKPAGWVAEMNYGKGAPGIWCRNAAIGYHDGAWRYMYGYYGQHHLVSPGSDVIAVTDYVESPAPTWSPPKFNLRMQLARMKHQRNAAQSPRLADGTD